MSPPCGLDTVELMVVAGLCGNEPWAPVLVRLVGADVPPTPTPLDIGSAVARLADRGIVDAAEDGVVVLDIVAEAVEVLSTARWAAVGPSDPTDGTVEAVLWDAEATVLLQVVPGGTHLLVRLPDADGAEAGRRLSERVAPEAVQLVELVGSDGETGS